MAVKSNNGFDYIKNIVNKSVTIAIRIEYRFNDLRLNFSFDQYINETIGTMNNITRDGNHKISKIAPTVGQRYTLNDLPKIQNTAAAIISIKTILLVRLLEEAEDVCNIQS